MKTHYYCSQCAVKQAVRTAEMATEDETLRKKAVLQCMKFLTNFDLGKTPSYFGSELQKIVSRVTDNRDPYKPEKERSTEFAEEMLEELEITDIETALKAALTANSIDYGGDNVIEYEKEFEEMMASSIVHDESEALFEEMEHAEKIVYFFDNAGEAVFDKKLIEFFNTEIVAVGKKIPMYNDVTVSELRAMGFENVIDCGENTGVLRLQRKLRREMEEADLIIAKGQANFESLPELWEGVFYLFKVKCRPVSEYLDRSIGSDMVIKI